MSRASLSPIYANADNPWRRLPWTIPATFLLWAIFIWSFGHFIGMYDSGASDTLPIDAQLVELPAPSENAQSKREIARPRTKLRPDTTHPEEKKASADAAPSPLAPASETTAKTDIKADSVIPPSVALVPQGSTAISDTTHYSSAVSPVVSASGNTDRSTTNGAVSILPSVIKGPPPAYPMDARSNGLTGRVRVRVLISEQGTVKDTVIAFSSGHASLDEAARQGLRRWLFKPAYRDGRAISAWVVVPVQFKLE